MSGFQGADTEALRAVSGAFSRRANEVDELAVRLAALIDSVAWVGSDADAFRSDWIARVRPDLHRCGKRISSDARELDQHAEEQDAASDPATDAGASGAGLPQTGGSAAGTAAGAALGGAASAIGEAAAVGAAVGGGAVDGGAVNGGAAIGEEAADGAAVSASALKLMSVAMPLADLAGAGAAADVSEKIGTGQLQFTDTGMILEPPATEHTVKVGAGHELAPAKPTDPFGLDGDGKPIPLEPSTRYDVGEHGTYYTDADGEVVFIEATGGGKAMNPNLRTVFPDATYHVNDSTYYQTDELGRTEHMFTPDVRIDRDMTRSQSIQSKIAERFDVDGPDGKQTISYDAGHVVARQLGGIREEINYTRQWDDVNQARKGADNIYAFESLMVDGIEDGKHYSYETRVNWEGPQPPGIGPDQSSAPWEYVPGSYDVRIHEDGEQIVEQHLPNYPEGATFTSGKAK